MLVIILIITTLTPYSLVFENAKIKQFEIFADFNFLFDILLCFNLGFYDNSQDFIVMNRKKIIYNYLQGLFIIDLLSSIPFGLLNENSPTLAE